MRPGPSETYAYSLEEVTQMVAVLPEPAATVAFYRVSQSIWKGFVTEPKTAKSKAPVPIIGLLAKHLEEHRARSGNPSWRDVHQHTEKAT